MTVVDLDALRYSTVYGRHEMKPDASVDRFDEVVFDCSKVANGDAATRYAITGQYINQNVMAAMSRAKVGMRDPTVAIPRAMACKTRYMKADYQCEVPMAAEVKWDAMALNVMVEDVLMDCQR